jgi:chromosome segregation ATPase
MHMAEAERRINQVKNDVDEIYGKLTAVGTVQAEHTKQLRTLNDTVAKIWTTQQQHGDKLNSLDAAVATISEQLREFRAIQVGHDARFTGIDQRFDRVDERFEKIDQRFEKIDQRLASQDEKLDLIMKALNIGAN